MVTKQVLERWLDLLDDILLGGPDKGATLMRLRVDMLFQREQHDVKATEPVRLPLLEPVRNVLPPKPGSSISVVCPTCFAREGKPCFRMQRRGPGAPPSKEIAPSFHHTRTRAAREAATQ